MARVPNTTTFNLQDVVDIVNPNSPGQSKIQRVYKSEFAVDAYVSCNGYGYMMYWDTNAEITVANFASSYGGSFGSVTVSHDNGDYLVFTGFIGDNYIDAWIDDYTSYVTTEQEAISPSYLPNLSACFTYANSAYFDPTYSGSKNALYNFRNYGVGTTNTTFYFTPDYRLNLSGPEQNMSVQFGQGTQIWIFKTDSSLINNSSWGSGNIRVRGYMYSNGIVFSILNIKVIRYNSALQTQQEFSATGYSGQTAYNIDRTISCSFTSGSTTDRLGVLITTSTTTTTTLNIWTGTSSSSLVTTFITTN
jgi:hypothetical protein